MKKIYKTALLALMSNFALAQGFFVPTTYKGAFAPAPTPMWTDNWTEWDPQNANYPAPTVNVTTNITTNTTWTSGNVYYLKGQIYVKNGATLTIEPGTIIRGDKTATGAGLFICKGSKIHAQGTAMQPIVFTSDQAPGSRSLGDWGGVILLGQAGNNQPGGVAYIEGIAPGADTEFGGGTSPDNNDDSGIMQYVRIEFAGYVYAPSKEINGLTFGSVGKSTIIDHIQVSFANDDGYEWVGGNVNCKYLVSYRNLDDDFDTDFGFSGMIQFGLSVRDPQIADDPAVSTSEGFESDNDASGSTATPQTSAIFANMTLIGPYRGNTGSTIAAGFRRGARIRRNSGLKIFNSIFMDHQRGVHIDGALCETNASNGTLKFMNNLVAGNQTGKVCEKNSGSTFNIWSWFASSSNDSLVSTSGILITPYNYTAPDYRPAGPLATGGGSFADATFSGLLLTAPTTNNIAYCQNATASPLTAGTLTGNTLLWYTSATGGTGSSTAPTPSTSSVGTTTYYVSQITTAGYESDRATITVTVNSLPTPSITAGGSTSFCPGGSVNLSTGSFTAYSWSTGGTAQNTSVTVGGNVTVTVTDVNGCQGTSAPTTITVYPAATVPVITAGGSTSFCTGDSVMLTSSTASGNVWSTTETTQSIYASSTGNYTVTYTDGNGCSATSSPVSVNVSSSPIPTIASSGSTTFCAGGSVTLTSSSADTYLWSTGATTQSITVSTAGLYNVTVTNSNACNGAGQSNDITVIVNPVPTAAGTIATQSGFTVTFSNTSSGATSYTWNFGDLSSSSATAPTHVYTANGNYTVTLIASNGTCSDTTTINVTVAVGIDEVSNISGVNIYPNPATDLATVNILLAESAKVSVTIFDITGKLINTVYNAQMNAGSNNVMIPTENMPAGIYFATISSEKYSKTLKLVITK